MIHKGSSKAPAPGSQGYGPSVGILTIVLLYAAFASLWILISDKTVEWLFGDPAWATLASTSKGLVFVAVTSVVLYGLMRRLVGRSDGSSVKVVSLRPLTLPLVLIALTILAMALGGIALTATQQKRELVGKLQTIADLKTRQIENWLLERYNDACYVNTGASWGELYHRWHDGGDTASGDLLQERLKDFRRYHSFQKAVVLDEKGKPFWSTEGRLPTMEPVLSENSGKAARENRVIRLGPYRDASGRFHLDFIAPLSLPSGLPGPTIILVVNFSKYLSSTLRDRSEPGSSSESLLFRQDGDQVVDLNEPREHPKITEGTEPQAGEKNPVFVDILGHKARQGGLVEGLDYRGVPVLAVVRPVPGTDWLLATKVDRSELYTKTAGAAIWIALAGLLGLFVSFTGAFVLRQRQELAASLREREIQAEKLRALQLLDAIAEGSADSIFAKDRQGRYLLFNREASRITGKNVQDVLGNDDTAIFPPDQARLIMANDLEVMTENRSVIFEEDVTTVDGEISLLATKGPLHDASGNVIGIFGVSRDVTELKRAERERELTSDFLRLVNECHTKHQTIQAAAAFLQQRSGCEAVAIRLEEGEDYPYYASRGFPPEFVMAESSLCSRDDMGEVVRDSAGYPVLACMCGNVIRGRYDPSKPFFSKNGSFWTNSTTELLAASTEADRQARTRNRCNGEGYESVALIPLIVGENRLGLLQLNDRRKGRFSPREIALWERLAGYLAVALAKSQSDVLRCESEEQFKAIFNTASIGIAQADPMTGRWVRVNRKMCEITGYSSEEMLTMRIPEITHPEDRERDWAAFQDVVSKKAKGYRLEKRYIRKDGGIIWVNLNMTVVRSSDDQPVRTVATIEDITERKLAEEALRQQLELRDQLAKIAASVPGAVHSFLLRPDGSTCMPFATSAVEDLFGIHQDALARDASVLLANVHPDDLQHVRETIEEAARMPSPWHDQYRYIHPAKGLRWIEGWSLPQVEPDGGIVWHGFLMDITDRKQLEEERSHVEAQLRQAQKMEALGTLAGGIAHDFNNILAIIIGYTELACLDSSGNAVLSPELEEVLRAANRAKDLVQQILAFSRMGEQEKKPVQVGLIVHEAMKMLRASLPSTIDIKQNVASKAVMLGDPTQIHQVLMNLCTNAAHAMREKGGVLEVSLTDSHLGPESIQAHTGLKPGPYLKLVVKDSGCGIDPSIAERIFDPFFTTKELGIGTGLGLSVVHGIVKRHGGAIEVESGLGNGAAFKVLFPAVERAQTPRAVASDSLPRGRERILVVDDEPSLAGATKNMLERLGYEAHCETNSVEALEVFRSRSREHPFDLVTTDMTMPRLTGADLAGELLRLQPNLPIVLCTGFNETINAETAKSLGIRGILMKPVALRELAELIRKELDKTAGAKPPA
jgi:PAS domain S-box-containing protein